MSIYAVPTDDSLDTIWTLLVWEDARLRKDANAADLAAGAEALLARWNQVSAGQRAVWQAEVIAQAAVDSCDDTIDATVNDIDSELLRVVRERDAPRYRRYFKQARNEIVRLGLESELEEVRTWPGSLQSEPEPALQALGARLEGDVEAGDAAVLERKQAAAARADHRVREVLGFIAEVNAARRARYGVLLQRAEERGLPPGWAEQLFKPSPGAKRGGGKRRKSAKGAKSAKSAAQPPASQSQPE